MGHMEFGLDVVEPRVVVTLPPPTPRGGLALLDALKARRSAREFSAIDLPDETLSELLWAAFGVNRPESGGRTAPSAHDWEEIDIYLALAKGLYRYQPLGHALVRLATRDLRAQTGMQDFVGEAPLNLVYVADLSRMTEASAAEREWYSGPDAGFIAQNVYLYCASKGLATVVRGMIDRPALAKAMALRPEQHIVLAQTVGFPKGR